MAVSSPNKILIVGPSWVGDMVMAQSLFMVLREQNPEVVIDVLAPAWSGALLERMPEVRRGIEMPVGHGQLQWGVRRQLGRELRAERYEQAILLPNSLKSALVPFFAKIPLRTGFVGEMRYGLLNDARKLDKSVLTMTVQRFVALGQSPGAALPDPIPVPRLTVPGQGSGQGSGQGPGQGSGQGSARAVTALGLTESDQPVLGLCPGAEYGPAKRWPEAHYADMARRYIERGWRVRLFGSDKDQPVTQTIRSALGDLAPQCDDLAGRTSLAQAIDLMSDCAAVVSNDSGLMHVAAALDRPLVAVYGSSDPNFTPPLNVRSRVVDLNLDCSPCFERECPLGHLDCLNQLDTDQVDTALGELIDAQKREV